MPAPPLAQADLDVVELGIEPVQVLKADPRHPLYTCNPSDFAGIKELEVIAVPVTGSQ